MSAVPEHSLGGWRSHPGTGIIGCMAAVLGRVTEWVSDDFPGWVKVEVIDADGHVLTFVDKVPVFAEESLDATTGLPKDVWLACDWQPAAGHRVRVALRHGVETDDGVRAFEVTPDRVR